MTKPVTGRLDRRGNFTTQDGTRARATFGKPWRDKWTGRDRVRVSVQLGPKAYAGLVYVAAAEVTLARTFSDRPGK